MALSQNRSEKIPLEVFHTECIFTRGGEKYLFELLRRLTSKYKITLRVHRITPYWEKQYTRQNISVQNLWTPKKFYWLLLPLTIFINVLVLKKTIHKNTLVFATNFPVNFLAVLLSKKTICHCFEPLAIFYDPHRIRSLSLFSRFCVKVAKYLYARLDKYAVNNSKILTSLNPSVTPFILAVYHRKPDEYIPNGVDVDFFSPKPKRSLKKTKLLIIGHSTDYTIFKGTEQFIHALFFLKKKSTNFYAYISETIHDQLVLNKYRNLIKAYNLDTHIRFVGNLSEKNLVTFYQSLGVYCYTGSVESAGGSTASLSVLEAQSCGVPVIRSTGNTDEIVKNHTGFYAKPNEPEEVANALFHVMHIPRKRRLNIQHEARNHVKKNHSWLISAEVLQNRLTTLYNTSL